MVLMMRETFGFFHELWLPYRYAIHSVGDQEFRPQRPGKFFRTGSIAGIQAKHARRLRVQLVMLDSARKPEDMNAPGWRLHRLQANLQGHWSIAVSGNWRVTFRFQGEDAILVDYRDYH
jgi:proteic killer suppression protein